MKARLILENGTVFNGNMFGAYKDVVGEVIFTTDVVGYQEIITNPAYTGQIVTMTFPVVGNYGINFEDMVSDKAGLTALIVREKCDYPSNFRNEMTLDDFLKQQDVVGLEGIDTRALTRIIRNNGTMKAVIASENVSDEKIKEMFEGYENSDVVSKVTTKEKYVVNELGAHNVAFVDMGEKDLALKDFSARNCRITVYPADASADEILAENPETVFVSNGPGSPKDVMQTVETVKELIGKTAICGVNMGHEIIALALGGEVEKLKFGHHGASYPVKDTQSGKAYITVQNHNYYVSKLPSDTTETFVNINDKTNEGFKHNSLPIQSVQFTPSDVAAMFEKFLKGGK